MNHKDKGNANIGIGVASQSGTGGQRAPEVQKKFPSRAVLVFVLIQVLTALVISLMPFDEYQSMREMFAPIDHNFRAFRTMFSRAPEPVAGKVFLLIWWVVFIPWGVVWTWRLTEGFRPFDPTMSMNLIEICKRLSIGLLVLLPFCYLFAFADFGEPEAQASRVVSRADVIPFLIRGGVLTASIWLAPSSCLLVVAISLVATSARSLVEEFILKGFKK